MQKAWLSLCLRRVRETLAVHSADPSRDTSLARSRERLATTRGTMPEAPCPVKAYRPVFAKGKLNPKIGIGPLKGRSADVPEIFEFCFRNVSAYCIFF
jgi:hypothetical protein